MIDQQIDVPADMPLVGTVLFTAGLVAAAAAHLAKQNNGMSGVYQWLVYEFMTINSLLTLKSFVSLS